MTRSGPSWAHTAQLHRPSVLRVLSVSIMLVLTLALGVGAALGLSQTTASLPLDIELHPGSNGADLPMAIENLYPGASAQHSLVIGLAPNSISAHPKMTVENRVDHLNRFGRAGELSRNLQMTVSTALIVPGSACPPAIAPSPVASALLADFYEDEHVVELLDRALTRSEALCVVFDLSMPFTAGNETQGARTTFDLRFIVEQDVMPTREVKHIAIDVLTEFAHEQTDSKERDRILKAVQHIRNSLLPEYWIDDTHLSERGKKAFHGERRAAHDLLKKYVQTQAVRDVADWLVAVDRELALVAIEEAQEYLDDAADDVEASGSSKAVRRLRDAAGELAKAIDHLASGDQRRDDQDLAKSIDEYRKAWERAQKADERVSEALVEAGLHRRVAADAVAAAEARLAQAKIDVAAAAGLPANSMRKAEAALAKAEERLASAQAWLALGDSATGTEAAKHYREAHRQAQSAIKEILRALRELRNLP
jgi:hypothetical protein